MNNSETLIVPAQTDTEAAYVYHRTDGTVERANSAAEAFDICPVLREMAQENPEQANILLELAAVGRQKLQQKPEEVNELLETEEVHEVFNEVKIEDEVPKETDIDRPATAKQPLGNLENTAAGSQEVISDAANYVSESVPQKASLEKQHTPPKSIERSSQPEIQEKGRSVNLRETNAPATKPQAVAKEQNKVKAHTTNEEILTAYEEILTTNEPKDTKIEPQLNDEAIVIDNEDFEIAEIEKPYLPPDYENELKNSVQTENYTEDNLEEILEPETVEVYRELITLEELSVISSLDTEANEIETQPVNEFELLVAEQPEYEEPVTLEVIQEEANEQTIEQTFIQIAELLKNETEDSPGPELTKLREIINDIEKALPGCFITDHEQEDIKLQITPEMTEKLLMLLRYLGYENPKEVLVDFVRQHRLAYLLQALNYICQLNNEIENKEFFKPFLAKANDDEDETLRMAKLLFGLIAKLN